MCLLSYGRYGWNSIYRQVCVCKRILFCKCGRKIKKSGAKKHLIASSCFVKYATRRIRFYPKMFIIIIHSVVGFVNMPSNKRAKNLYGTHLRKGFVPSVRKSGLHLRKQTGISRHFSVTTK